MDLKTAYLLASTLKASGGSFPDISNLVLRFDVENEITKDGNDYVTQWGNQIDDNYYAQSTASKRFKYIANGGLNKPCIRSYGLGGRGNAEFMYLNTIKSISSEFTQIVVLNEITRVEYNMCLDSEYFGSGWFYGGLYSTGFYMGTPSGNLYSGLGRPSGAFKGYIAVVRNSTNSKLIINGTVVLTGNLNNVATKFDTFCNYYYPTICEYYEKLTYDKALNSTELEQIDSYIKGKYGIS